MDLSDRFLDSLRHVGDLDVDTLIATWSPTDAHLIGALFKKLVRTDEPLPKDLPSDLADYFRDTSEWPSWADRRLVRRGEAVFSKYGPELIAGLFCAALPQCYANHKGVPVLTMTGRMEGTGIGRRILETAQFLCDIVDEGGMEPTGRGIRTIQKIRLMHAGIRVLVLLGPGADHFDVAARGIPICQEDLAFTLMSFSVVLLDSVEATGITVGPEDREAWVHLWRVVGHFIGLRDDANPRDYAEAQAFAAAYRRRNFGPSQEGKDLTAALVDFMKRVVPGSVADRFPAAFIRCMNPPEIPEWLGVERAPVELGVIKLEVRVLRVLDRLFPGKVGIVPGSGSWFDALLRFIATKGRPEKGAPFRVPRALSLKRGGLRRGRRGHA